MGNSLPVESAIWCGQNTAARKWVSAGESSSIAGPSLAGASLAERYSCSQVSCDGATMSNAVTTERAGIPEVRI